MSDRTATPNEDAGAKSDEAEVVKTAWHEYRRGNHENALMILQNGLKRNPNSAPLHLELAKMYHELKDSNKTIEYCAKAQRIDPENSLAYSLMGFAYISRRQTDKAVPLLRKAIQLDPHNTYAYEDLGRIVLAATMTVVDMDPNYLNASISVGRDTPIDIRLLEEAIRYRQRGCNNNWQWMSAYYRMGVLYYYAGHPDKALKCIHAAADKGYEPAEEWLKER